MNLGARRRCAGPIRTNCHYSDRFCPDGLRWIRCLNEPLAHSKLGDEAYCIFRLAFIGLAGDQGEIATLGKHCTLDVTLSF